MQANPKALELLKRCESLKEARRPYESQWNDVQKLVRLHAKTLYSQTEGDRRYDGIYDATAVESLETLANGLHAYMTSPSDRWFGFEVVGGYALNDDPAVLLWLEQVADLIYDVYQNPAVSLSTALHEGYLDLGGFGHCIVYQEEDPHCCVRFRTYPVADCWLDEDAQGMVDTLFRQVSRTGRQLSQMGWDLPPELLTERGQADSYNVIHAVFPRTDRNPVKLTGTNKPWASFWILEQFKQILHEGGFTEFPYHVPRWLKIAGERYGRSPAMKCLPDIKMLNRMEITTLRAGTKQVDPPLVVPDDGFLLPIQTHPGALIFKEPGAGEIQVLEAKGNLPWAEEKSEQKRGAIRRAFHVDWVMRQRKNANVEQSATEITDDREESLRMMSPMLGRLQGELLGPILERTFAVLLRKGQLPPVPQVLQGRRLKMAYISPAARAQDGVKAQGIGRAFTDLAPIAQLDPSVLDAVNMDVAAQELLRLRGATRRIIRTPEEIAHLRQQKAQMQQAQMAAQMAEPASKAALNFAKAKEAGGGVGVL